MRRCISLFSGGLDSMLAINYMKEQNIDVIAVFFDTGFNSKIQNYEILKSRAQKVGAQFLVIDVKKDYLDVLFNPKYGYGKHFNPCIDCHGFMAKNAINCLKDLNADFVITGEVLGQRPMSQNKNSLNVVAKLSDDENLILRPLSAKLMPPTKPEILGWVDREKLGDISGRGRKEQLRLANLLGIEEFATPAGGCLLTMENFSNKIKDAMKFNEIDDELDLEILKFGRHIRLKNGTKLIIGRDESENNALINLNNKNFYEIKFNDEIVGAHSFIHKNYNELDLEFAISLALAYTKCDKFSRFDAIINDMKFNDIRPVDKNMTQEFLIR